MIRTAALVVITSVGGFLGMTLAQAVPIGDQTTITIGLVAGLATGAFYVGTVLTGIKRDIKELRGAIHSLPCTHKNSDDGCPDK